MIFIAFQGYLQVEVIPCTKEGNNLTEQFVEEPEELVSIAYYYIVLPNIACIWTVLITLT